MANELKTIMPGVQVRFGARGESIRFFAMVKGRRFSETCPIGYGALVNPKTGKPTPICKQAYAEFLSRCRVDAGWNDGMPLKVPSIGEWLECYEDAAWKRNALPAYHLAEQSVRNNLKNIRTCIETAGLGLNEPLDRLMNTATIRRIFEARLLAGVKGTTAWTNIVALQSGTAAWTKEIYLARGWKVERPIIPDVGRAKEAPRYQRLSKELRAKIDEWYIKLDEYGDKPMQLAVTIMFNLALRPCDVGRLSRRNFCYCRSDKHMHLVYMPSKTRESSGAWVNYPIDPMVFDVLKRLADGKLDGDENSFEDAELVRRDDYRSDETVSEDELLVPAWRWVFHRINCSMRVACGMKDTNKAAYELRKICIDTYYHERGAAAAAALSGDRQTTIEYYYADPGMVTNVVPLAISPTSVQ